MTIESRACTGKIFSNTSCKIFVHSIFNPALFRPSSTRSEMSRNLKWCLISALQGVNSHGVEQWEGRSISSFELAMEMIRPVISGWMDSSHTDSRWIDTKRRFRPSKKSAKPLSKLSWTSAHDDGKDAKNQFVIRKMPLRVHFVLLGS